ncbi:MAG: hypothetical protein M3Y55_02205 [Pseudomonadota bacterium]|nr:hypothetical protein [Pseudomonadota bacterium]
MSTTITARGVTTAEIDDRDDEPAHGVSWAAIFAGAAAAAALSLILVVLGVGLGFSVASPWTATRDTVASAGAAALAWLAFTQIAASSFGGYLVGRLRLRWVNVHRDEVWFRDTAHGLLAWAVASLVTAAFLGSAIGGVLAGAAQTGGEALKGAAMAASSMSGPVASAGTGSANGGGNASQTPYFVDTLFRSDTAQAADPNDAQTRAEATRIFANDMRVGTMGPADVRYLGQVVTRRTGVTPAEAEKRVADAFTQASKAMVNAETAAKQAADDARKAAAYSALWMFVALLAGAFFASVAALVGGRQRDNRV